MPENLKIAIAPGSFDPLTYGHLDIITRASRLFDKVIAVVVKNPAKQGTFAASERVEMLKIVTRNISNVEVDFHDGLLVDYVREKQACAIVKGLRALSDFEYEFAQALINKEMYAGADTVFLTTKAENMYLSSSVIREIAAVGGDISPFIPPEIRKTIEEKLRRNNR